MMREPDFVDECYADKDLSLLKKLTLVIPTYNRNCYLSRCLWYHAHFPFGEIIVADSSPEEKKVVNRETVQRVRETFRANILYLEYEPETEKYGGDIYRKWGDSVQHVETEYSLIVTDKAFLFADCLTDKLNFLEENRDYCSAQGMWAWLKFSGIKEPKYRCIIGNDFNPPTGTSLNNSIERYLLGVNNNWNNKLFSVFRSDIHKKIYSQVVNIHDIRYGEILLSLLPLIIGKCMYCDSDVDLIRDITQLDAKGSRNVNESSSSRYPSRLAYGKLGVLSKFYAQFEGEIISAFHVYCPSLSDSQTKCILRKTRDVYYQERVSLLSPCYYVLGKPKLVKIWMKLPISIKNIVYDLQGRNKGTSLSTKKINLVVKIVEKNI